MEKLENTLNDTFKLSFKDVEYFQDLTVQKSIADDDEYTQQQQRIRILKIGIQHYKPFDILKQA